ncbi:hypothetical protein N7451_005539 [Penicillium sp. IBT 35674x]|nr:hypothetical protein N7451_005539 [Penicillium sp. IBT 35674x]
MDQFKKTADMVEKPSTRDMDQFDGKVRDIQDMKPFKRTIAFVYPHYNEITHAESEFTGPGWQRKRAAENFIAFLSNKNPLPEVNFVNDELTKMQ